MIRKIALGLFALIAVACISIAAVASTRPDTYHVERNVTIAAPPSEVHAVLEDLRRFHEWSPWQKLDPAMKVTFSGPPTGVGASSHWVGNDKIGEGRMTITESTPPTSISETLEFIKPFPSVADIRFTIAAEGEASKVTWAMDGKADFMTKVMCLFVSMDAMIGKDFEAGLASLQRVAESSLAPAGADSTKTM